MIFNIFSTPISTMSLSQFDNTNEYFYNKVKDLKNVATNLPDWRCDTFATIDMYDLTNDPVFNPILTSIKNYVIEFARSFGVSYNNVNCRDAWLNLAEPGQYQEYHIHPNNHFSIAYYVKTPVNCGNIVFRSHEASTDMLPLPSCELMPNNWKTYYLTPHENDLVIFRSNVYHMVEKNHSNEDRVSISANFYF